VANALNPAHVTSVFVSDQEKICRVVVPDSQLSLAIGKEGQNARLAAKLTTWKIDIKSQTQVSELIQLQQQSGAGSPENQGSVIMDDDEGYDNPIVPDEDEIL
jgi:N utilization substance protein A